MQVLGKFLLLSFLACYLLLTDAKSKTVKDTVVDGATHLKEDVVEGATHIKDSVVDGVKIGAKVAADAAKNAG